MKELFFPYETTCVDASALWTVSPTRTPHPSRCDTSSQRHPSRGADSSGAERLGLQRQQHPHSRTRSRCSTHTHRNTQLTVQLNRSHHAFTPLIDSSAMVSDIMSLKPCGAGSCSHMCSDDTLLSADSLQDLTPLNQPPNFSSTGKKKKKVLHHSVCRLFSLCLLISQQKLSKLACDWPGVMEWRFGNIINSAKSWCRN